MQINSLKVKERMKLTTIVSQNEGTNKHYKIMSWIWFVCFC